MASQQRLTHWKIDEDGYMVSQAGTRCARFESGTLYLYDRKSKSEVPFTLIDWALLSQENPWALLPNRGESVDG